MNQNIVTWNLCTCHPHPHSWTYSAPLTASSCSLKHIREDQLWQQEAPAHSTVHTVLIICSADILRNANMLRLLHQSVCLGSPCSPAELLRCLAWPLPPIFHMGQESRITSHILAIPPSYWPAQTPWCATLLRSITGYFTPTQSSLVCLIACLSHADPISQIPWLERSHAPKPAHIPAWALT
jgi:hypothetical protein